jgi:hypothetical protein
VQAVRRVRERIDALPRRSVLLDLRVGLLERALLSARADKAGARRGRSSCNAAPPRIRTAHCSRCTKPP